MTDGLCGEQEFRGVVEWSPEQIANRIKLDFPDDESARVGHVALYHAHFIEGRDDALPRELILRLRTGRALGAQRAPSRRKTRAQVMLESFFSERPAEAEDRAMPGHWEGDLIIGLERSAIGAVVERTTRFTMLVHLPREVGYRHRLIAKKAPALAGHGALNNTLANATTTADPATGPIGDLVPGKEMSAPAQFRVDTGIPAFFADPHNPRQRETSDNTDGVLRRRLPKGTNLSRWAAEEVEAVAPALNTIGPRKTFRWKRPTEGFNEQLLPFHQALLRPTSDDATGGTQKGHPNQCARDPHCSNHVCSPSMLVRLAHSALTVRSGAATTARAAAYGRRVRIIVVNRAAEIQTRRWRPHGCRRRFLD
ncbi:IS30 family transposase [Nocardioides sp. LML1-1-1.1]|uniref:IS30 family transposase n=1 Tax=Nocardioides sp. LML1-1-1.1 TaxID=3135248 RepID=UPI00342B8164